MQTRRQIIQCALLCSGGAILARPVRAAETRWPDRPVHIVVPNPPGGTADITARIVFASVGEALRQSFVVENRAGGNGTIAMVAVGFSKPDGYTFVVAGDSATYVPLMEKKPPFQMDRDFAPVSLLVTQPVVLAVNSNSGIQSVAGLIARAKAEPGKLSYGVSGIGSTHHMAAAMFCEKAGIEMTVIPYKGGGQAVTDLVGGQIPVAFLGAGAVASQARSGRIRMLAVTSAERSPSLPGVPTLREAGIPGIDITQWFALFAPHDTPSSIQHSLQRQVAAALHHPTIRKKLSENAIDAVGSDAATLARRMRIDSALWLATMKRLGLKLYGA